MCVRGAHAYSYARLAHGTYVRHGTRASSRQARLGATRALAHSNGNAAAVGGAAVLRKREECARACVRERASAAGSERNYGKRARRD